MNRHQIRRGSLLTLLTLVPLGFLFLRPGFGGYDWDWFFAHYEALRQSVVGFHQFPWWNPWSAGGIPLFADPQLGFPSPISLLVCLFGTSWGLKIAVLLHYAAGLWGIFFLLRYVRRQIDQQTAFLLAVIWIYSGFTVFHTMAGHVSFLQYLLVPWCILALVHHQSRWWWLRAIVVWSFYILAGPHYIVIQSFFITAPFLILEFIRTVATDRRRYGFELLLVLAGMLMVTAPRVYYSISYLADFPRHALIQWGVDIHHLFRAFVVPDIIRKGAYFSLGSWEVYAFMGASFVLYGALGCILEVRYGQRVRKAHFVYWILFFLGLMSCVLALGAYSHAAPYAVIMRWPFLSWMQVPSRWLGWAAFFWVLAAGAARVPKRVLTQFLLMLAVIEVVTLNVLVQPTPFRYFVSQASPSAPGSFQQYEQYPGPIPQVDESQTTNAYLAIRHHFGEVRAYEPILGYNIFRPTDRCGLNHGCPLLTGATLIYWSPNRLIIRGQPGNQVRLNNNNANGWMLNGRRLGQTSRIFDNQQGIAFTMPSSGEATLTFRPAMAGAIYGSLWLLFVLCVLMLLLRRGNPPAR